MHGKIFFNLVKSLKLFKTADARVAKDTKLSFEKLSKCQFKFSLMGRTSLGDTQSVTFKMYSL